MRRRLIILAILVGFLVNIAVYIKTINYIVSYPDGGGVTLDCSDYVEQLALEGGVPLESATTKNYIIRPCTGADDTTSKLDMTVALMTTPQFYLNWAIWSGLLVGIVYISTRKKS